MNKKKVGKIILIILLVLFAIFSIVSLVLIKDTFDEMFGRTAPKEYCYYLRYEDVKADYEREELTFESKGNQLQGYLYGVENTNGLVVLCHGMGGGAESYTAETLYFVDNGYQVFSFDNTGCYQSEGENCVGLSQSVIDLDAALTYIENESRFDELPIYLYGHSWGGYAVTAIFNYEHDIAASVSVSGFNKPMAVIMEWTKEMMGGFAYVEQPYIRIYQQMLFGKNANMSAVDGINNTDTPILLIHGKEDTMVRVDGSATIAYRDEITNPNVQYKICDGEKQNDHNGCFISLDSLAYIEELDMEHDRLEEEYDGEIPEEVSAEFFGKIDKSRTSQMDGAFMQDVLAFYENAGK